MRVEVERDGAYAYLQNNVFWSAFQSEESRRRHLYRITHHSIEREQKIEKDIRQLLGYDAITCEVIGAKWSGTRVLNIRPLWTATPSDKMRTLLQNLQSAHAQQKDSGSRHSEVALADAKAAVIQCHRELVPNDFEDKVYRLNRRVV